MRARWIASSLAATVSCGLALGSAASVGGFNAGSLLNIDRTGSTGAPAVIGCDNFTGTTGENINGRAATSAGACNNRVWTATVGSWSIQSNSAASSPTMDAAITQDTASVSCTARVVLSNLHNSGRSGGLIISHDGTSTYLAAVMINGNPDRIELRLYTSGNPAVLTTYNPAFATTNTLQLSRSGAAITTTLNGTTIGTFTLTGSQQTALGSGARAGVYGGTSGVRFDDFAVTTP